MGRYKIILMLLVGFPILPGLFGQIDIYGEVSPAFVQSSNVSPQLTVNEGRPTFLWRLDLLADAYISDNITVYINLRSHQDQVINIDNLAIRITDIIPAGINLQAGKFDMPFGNLYSRRFPSDNFLFDLPLLYQYHTVVMSDYLFPSRQALLNSRGQGGTQALPSSMPILDRGIYGTGIMLFGSFGIVDYFAALMNGTVSNTGSYGNSLNVNSDLGKLFRIAVTPAFGLTLGGAFTWGSYLSDNIDTYLPGYTTVTDYKQYAASFDFEYSRGHIQIFSQAVYNSWEHPIGNDRNLDAFGYYAETKYTVRPRWFVSTRINQLLFSKITIDGIDHRWDFDVLRIEGAIGYAVDRNILVKAVVHETWVYGDERTAHSMIALQLAARF
jgi:hypothetical protein